MMAWNPLVDWLWVGVPLDPLSHDRFFSFYSSEDKNNLQSFRLELGSGLTLLAGGSYELQEKLEVTKPCTTSC